MSADARVVVWKISAEMIIQRPLLGYGYGSFERNYSLFQSNYFKSGKVPRMKYAMPVCTNGVQRVDSKCGRRRSDWFNTV
jgi:hypothetical protein